MGTQDGVKLACQPCATCLKKLDAEERKKEKLKEDVQDDDAEAIEDDEQEEDGKKMPRSTADAGKTQARSAMKQALQQSGCGKLCDAAPKLCEKDQSQAACKPCLACIQQSSPEHRKPIEAAKSTVRAQEQAAAEQEQEEQPNAAATAGNAPVAHGTSPIEGNFEREVEGILDTNPKPRGGGGSQVTLPGSCDKLCKATPTSCEKDRAAAACKPCVACMEQRHAEQNKAEQTKHRHHHAKPAGEDATTAAHAHDEEDECEDCGDHPPSKAQMLRHMQASETSIVGKGLWIGVICIALCWVFVYVAYRCYGAYLQHAGEVAPSDIEYAPLAKTDEAAFGHRDDVDPALGFLPAAKSGVFAKAGLEVTE